MRVIKPTVPSRRFILFLLIAAFASGPNVHARDSVSRQIAGLYAREAAGLVDDLPADMDEFDRLVGLSLEYDPEQADALHLRAVLGSVRDEPRAHGIGYLERALAIADFRHTSRREAHLLLGRFYFETGRYEDLLAVVEPVSDANHPDPDALFLRSKAHFGLGDIRAAEQIAEYGRQVFPDDPRFVSLLVLRNDAPGAVLLDELSVHEGSVSQLYRRALLHYIRMAAGNADRERALRLYDASGGRDPIAAVYDTRLSGAERLSAFIDNGGLEDPYAIRTFLESAVSDEYAELLRRRITGIDGRFPVDVDRSGRAPLVVEFEAGRLTSMRIDENTDGLFNLELLIDPRTGLPTTAALPQSGKTFEYRRYPEVGSVRYGDERLAIQPGMLRVRVFEGEDFWSGIPLSAAARFPTRVNVRAPDRESILETTFLREIERDGRIVSVERLFRGQTVLRMDDSRLDGTTDTVVYYEAGVIRRVLRDVLGDGYFEVLEEYRDGLLSIVGFDSTQDGIYDYIEQYDNGVLREWDVTSDRNVDIREQTFSDSIRRAEFLQFLDAQAPRIDRLWSILSPVF